MIPDHLIGSMVALSPADAIAAIRRRLGDGGEAGDLSTSDVGALSQAEATVAVLRGRVEAAEAEAARRTDEVVAIGEALGREGATGAECVGAIRAMATGEGR